MTFTIPNQQSASYVQQSYVDSVDLMIATAGTAGYGVISGCAVTAGTGMQVTVAAGVVIAANTYATVAGGNLSISAADSTNPRTDLVVANNAGAISVTTGTAAIVPLFPTIPANSVVLAVVYVPAAVAAITSGMITDKRVMVASIPRPEIFVAASNASLRSKSSADYVCTGTNDQAVIATALAALPASGGIVKLSEGTFTFGATLSWTYNNTALVGVSRDATQIVSASGVNIYLITFAPAAGENGLIRYARFEHFTIDQNLTVGPKSGGGGIHAFGCKETLFFDLHITDFYDRGLWLDVNNADSTTYGHNNTVMSCIFDNTTTSNGDGCGVRTNSCDENSFVDCQFQYLGGATAGGPASGFYENAGLQRFIGCTWVAGKNGLWIQDMNNNVVSGCTFDSCTYDSLHMKGERNSCIGNVFTSAAMASANTYSHVVIETYGTDAQCTIVGNYFATNAAGNSLRSVIREQNATSGNNVIVGNTIKNGGVAPGTAYIETVALTSQVLANGSAARAGNKGIIVDVRDFLAVGDGTTDNTTAIANAITAVYNAGGGTVFFPAGTYLTGQIVLKNHVCLRGAGTKATILKLKNGTNANFIINYVSPDGIIANAEYCGVFDLYLNCNKGNQTGTSNGIYFTTNPLLTAATNDEDFDTHQTLENVIIDSALTNGFQASGRANMKLINVEANHCSGSGFVPGFDSELILCVAGNNTLHGFDISTGSSTHLSNCAAFYSGQFGFSISGSVASITLTNCHAQDNGQNGFGLNTVSQVHLSGCVADSNSTAAAGTYPGLGLFATTNSIFDVVCFERKANGVNSYQTQALRVRSGSTGNIIRVTHSAYGGATIGAAIFATSDSLPGNIISIGTDHITAPTAAAGTNAGTTPPAPVVVAGTMDNLGTITFGTGTGPSAGQMVSITFATAFFAAPFVTLTANNTATQALGLYVYSVNTTNLVIGCTNAPAASQGNTVYSFNFLAKLYGA